MDMPHARIHLLGFPGSPGWHAVPVLSVLHHTYPWMCLWMAIVVGNLNLRSNDVPCHQSMEYYFGLVACLQYVLRLERVIYPRYPHSLRLLVTVVHVADG